MCGIRVIYLFKSLHFFRCHIVISYFLWRLDLHFVLRWVLCILVTLSTLQRCAQMYDMKIIFCNFSNIISVYRFSAIPASFIMYFLVSSNGGALLFHYVYAILAPSEEFHENSVFHQISGFFISSCHRCVNCYLFLVQMSFIEMLYTIFLIFAFRPSKFISFANFVHRNTIFVRSSNSFIFIFLTSFISFSHCFI